MYSLLTSTFDMSDMMKVVYDLFDYLYECADEKIIFCSGTIWAFSLWDLITYSFLTLLGFWGGSIIMKRFL